MARCFWGLFFFWCYPLVSCAISPDTIRLSQAPPIQFFYNKATVIETGLDATLQSVRRQEFPQRLTENYPVSAIKAYWLHIVIQNDTDRLQQLFCYTSNNQTATFYRIGTMGVDTLQTGVMVSTSNWAFDENDMYVPLTVLPNSTLTLYVRLANAQGLVPFLTDFRQPRPVLRLQLEREQYHLNRSWREYRRNMAEFQYRAWIQGALLFFLIFIGLLYGQYRQRIYRYYFLYVLAGASFAILKIRSYTPIGHWLGYFPLLRTHLLEVVMWLGIGAYLFFLDELLDLRQNHLMASRWFRRIAWSCVSFGLIYGILMVLTNDGGIQQATFWGTRYALIPMYVGTLFWIGRSVKSPLTRYVILGNACMAAVGVLAWLRAGEVILKGVKLPGSVDDLMTVSFAVLLEILVFAMALARRIQLLDQDRNAHQQAYINQLEENRRLTTQINSELEQKVQEKTTEILEAQRLLENQRVSQLRSDYEKRITEIEMLALRSQMNPHFLFNSLNTLEYFILSGEERKASDYLSKFSRLLRMILNHSREETISLAEELTALRLYIEIEATRFGEDFHYTLAIDSAIDLSSVVVPPLLLQPFVENAIWHGLMQSDKPDKNLVIRIRTLDEHHLSFEIEDNGIGRKKAVELKSKSAMRQKSYGMEITNQRVELFNRSYPSQIAVQLVDLQTNAQTGTLIQITYTN